MPVAGLLLSEKQVSSTQAWVIFRYEASAWRPDAAPSCPLSTSRGKATFTYLLLTPSNTLTENTFEPVATDPKNDRGLVRSRPGERRADAGKTFALSNGRFQFPLKTRDTRRPLPDGEAAHGGRERRDPRSGPRGPLPGHTRRLLPGSPLRRLFHAPFSHVWPRKIKRCCDRPEMRPAWPTCGPDVTAWVDMLATSSPLTRDLAGQPRMTRGCARDTRVPPAAQSLT